MQIILTLHIIIDYFVNYPPPTIPLHQHETQLLHQLYGFQTSYSIYFTSKVDYCRKRRKITEKEEWVME